MARIEKGNSKILIPSDTLVLICGSQRSGKTTFAQKHFTPEQVISTDDIFEDVVKSKTSVFDNFNTILNRTEYEFEKELKYVSRNHSITVIDAAPVDLEGRVEMIKRFKNLHKSIVLIVLDVKYDTLISRPRKKISEKKKKLGITGANEEDFLYNSLMISTQINKGSISTGTDTTYVLSEKDIKNCRITFC